MAWRTITQKKKGNMFQKLSKQEVEADNGHGIFCEGGFVDGTTGFIMTQGNAGWFLIPRDQFTSAGPDFNGMGQIGIKLSTRALLAIGGRPKTEAEILAEEMNISILCARDVLYLRTRKRWSLELEKELIALHAAGVHPNMCEFGCTAETAAALLWTARSN